MVDSKERLKDVVAMMQLMIDAPNESKLVEMGKRVSRTEHFTDEDRNLLRGMYISCRDMLRTSSNESTRER